MIKHNKKLLDSNKVKTSLISHMLYKWGYLGAVTEYVNYSDVYGIRRNFYTVEFEIKLFRNDLLREVNIIKKILRNKNTLSDSGNKTYKHANYLGFSNYRRIIPNEFNFVVPDKLEEIKTELINTPYGLYIIKADSNSYLEYEIKQIIRPQKLHKRKISNIDLPRFFRKLSTENIVLRERLYLND